MKIKGLGGFMVARRTSKAEIVVYTYGVGLGVIDNVEAIYDAMDKAHRYQNKLIEIERSRRESLRRHQREEQGLEEFHRRVDEAKNAVEQLKAAAKAYRMDQMTRKAPPGHQERLTAALEEEKAAKAALRDAKQAMTVQLRPKYEAVEDEARVKGIEARTFAREDGLFHGTYQLVEANVKATRTALVKRLDPKDDPRFRPYPKTYGSAVPHIARGRFGIVTGGNSVMVSDALDGTSRWLQIQRLDPSIYDLPIEERKPKMRALVKVRVGSDDKGHPVWAVLHDVILHRPLPEDGKITMAWLKTYMLGDRPEDRKWELQLTVEAESLNAQFPKTHATPETVVALNLGWRLRDNGYRRVSFLVDAEGNEDEVLFASKPRFGRGPQDGDRFDHVDHLKSLRMKLFNNHKELLALFLDMEAEIPEFFKTNLETLRQWESSSRLAAFVRLWEQNRHPGDEEIFRNMWMWLEQDSHLYRWETRERTRAIRSRTEHYRHVARKLCAKYAVIVLGDINLAHLARKLPEDNNDSARVGRFRVAPSEFIGALNLMARKFGTKIIRLPANNVSKTCHCCGATCSFDAATELEVKCSSCGSTWDQDANHCRNLLKAYKEVAATLAKEEEQLEASA